ncbi:MAG: YdeI/OmpD-associated family protein, partial [Acidimicrobiia bacterium]|nr:YdeI/OmpD-associated family protein [Acidimicrobiia bacterium]
MPPLADSAPDGLPIIAFADSPAFETWLETNSEVADGLWVRFAKAKSGIDSVTYSEAVDVALCHGWIDAQKRGYDDLTWIQRFVPRRPKSKWSQTNRERIERLTAAGRMRPGGLREVERAKEDGRWDDAYPGARNATIPDDLQKALDEAGLGDAFAGLKSAERYSVIYRLHHTKRAETRARTIATLLD